MSALQQEIQEAVKPLQQQVKTLTGMVESLIEAQNEERPIPLKEAAKRLNICSATLRTRVHEGAIECIRMGGKNMFFTEDALKKFQDQNT